MTVETVTTIKLSGQVLPSVRVGTDGTAVVSFDGDDSTVELVGPAHLVEKWLDRIVFDLNLAKRSYDNYVPVTAAAVVSGEVVCFPEDGFPRRWWQVSRVEHAEDGSGAPLRFWLKGRTLPKDVDRDTPVRVARQEAVA